MGNVVVEVVANKQSGFIGVLCIVLRFQRFPKLTEVVDIADLGLDIVGACAEDSSEPLSDAFSKVVLLCANRIRGAVGMLLVADRDFVGINPGS